MKRTFIVFAVALAVLLAVGSMSYSQEQNTQKKETSGSTSKEQKTIYYCPMHSEVVSNKPGKCPKCGMNLVLRKEEKKEEAPEASSAKEQILNAKAILDDAKQSLVEDGKYNCCIKEPCDRCALDHQSCPCYKDLKANKGVCSDCYAGWKLGEGVDKDINPAQVKMATHGHKH